MAVNSATDEQLQDCSDRISEIRDLSTFTITKPLLRSTQGQSGSVLHGALQTCCMQVDGHVLCEACVELLNKVSEIISGAENTDNGNGHTIALDYLLCDLRASARLGCHLCSIMEANTIIALLRGKPSTYKKETEESFESWLSLDLRPRDPTNLGQSWSGSLRLIQPGLETTNPIYLEFSPTSIPGFIPPQRADILPGSSRQSTSDQNVFGTIETWLHKCHTQHDSCRKVRPPEPNVPSRLLELGETQVRVVENTQSLEYACLSHCWGSQEHVPKQLLENGTHQAFDITTLPKTFLDAVCIVKSLGLKHLWIDCFCILQGSREDWLRESAVMAQIYANSAFTIAALAATNVTEGCFRDRNRLALQTLYTKDLTVKSLYPSHSWRLEVNGYDYQSSPLHTRAWVVQERLSATRTIFYGAMGIYWECRCTRASESYTHNLPTDISQTDSFEENVKLLLIDLQSAAEVEDKWHVYSSVFFDRWNQLLRNYTQCNLTYATDKLIALSGITRDIEKYSGRTFIQGLWAEDLGSGLLWRHNRLDNTPKSIPSRRYPSTIFPSWSWASFEGMIVHLTGSGPVIWQPRITPISSSSSTQLHLVTWKREVNLIDEDNIALVDDGSRTGDLTEEYLWYSDERTIPEDIRLWAVLVQRTESSNSPSSFSRAARCLIVEDAGTDHPVGTSYRRLGVSVIRFDRPKYDPFPTSEPIEGVHDVVLI